MYYEKGIAPQMAAAFGCDKFPLEDKQYKGDPSKQGKIDYKELHLGKDDQRILTVVNAYTQYDYRGIKPFSVEAFTLCMKELNSTFPGKHIGMPMIGAGLAGGSWEQISEIIEKELKDCQVTVVRYKP